jgi:hypothetical protein
MPRDPHEGDDDPPRRGPRRHRFVLLTRIKDLGHGREPMFYTLVWKRHDGGWRLLREYVHQKSIPKRL